MEQDAYNQILGMRGKDLYTTGSYGKDVGAGFLSALNYAFNKPGDYYVKANYAGHGLANTGLGYTANPEYKNPYDYMNALISSMYNNKDKNNNESMFKNLLDRNEKAQFPLKTQAYNLTQVGNIGGGSVGDYGNAYNSWFDYSLPAEPISFNKFWE